MNITCIIVEDLPSFSTILINFLNRIPDVEIVASASNERDATIEILEHNPDIIFMDINLGNGSGFQVLENCKKSYKFVVFTTAYSEYSIKSYSYNTLHYLLKPYKLEVVNEAINKARYFLEQTNISSSILKNGLSKKIIFLPDKNKYIPIEIDKIIYIEAKSSYSIIHLENENFQVSKPLGKILEMTNENKDIARIHKSYAININAISQVKRGLNSSIELKNNITLPISIQEKDELFRLLGIKN